MHSTNAHGTLTTVAVRVHKYGDRRRVHKNDDRRRVHKYDDRRRVHKYDDWCRVHKYDDGAVCTSMTVELL